MIPIKAIRFIEKIENKLELYHKHSWGGGYNYMGVV